MAARAVYFGLAGSAPANTVEVSRRVEARRRFQEEGLRQDEAAAAGGGSLRCTAIAATSAEAPTVAERTGNEANPDFDRGLVKWVHVAQKLRARTSSLLNHREVEASGTTVTWSTVDLYRSQQAHPYSTYCDYLSGSSGSAP